MNSHLRIGYDIDGTLFHAGTDKPNFDIIMELQAWLKKGARVYVWSGSGVDYARMVVRRFGWNEEVFVIPKWGLMMDIAYDDQKEALAQTGKGAKVVVIV